MTVKIHCLRVSQNLGEFYVASMRFQELLKIVRRDPRDWATDASDTMVGVQRDIKESRVNKIAKYLTYDFATFPTSVVIALDERFVSITPKENCDPLVEIEVDNFETDDGAIDVSKCGYIIDGQHRLFGLKKAAKDVEDFQINVSIFVGIDTADRAEIFSTVNLTQTKVNKSHVYDLYDYQIPPSPYRTSHDVVVALDKLSKSPFFQRIKRLGIATEGRASGTERLSQATVVRGLLRFLPVDPDFERQKGIDGIYDQVETRENPKSRFLAPFYRRDDTSGILRLYINYFRAVESRWPIAWEDEEDELMLSLTNGFEALNRFLRDLYLDINPEPQNPIGISVENFLDQLKLIKIDDNDFTSDKYPAGGPGASKLYHDIYSSWKSHK